MAQDLENNIKGFLKEKLETTPTDKYMCKCRLYEGKEGIKEIKIINCTLNP